MRAQEGCKHGEFGGTASLILCGGCCGGVTLGGPKQQPHHLLCRAYLRSVVQRQSFILHHAVTVEYGLGRGAAGVRVAMQA